MRHSRTSLKYSPSHKVSKLCDKLLTNCEVQLDVTELMNLDELEDKIDAKQRVSLTTDHESALNSG